MTDLVRARRALISVSDKTGVVDLATALAGMGVDLVSTGGTAAALREAGLDVKDVAELTGFPEMMDGRVKTLHPGVHGGLLALRDNPQHVASMELHALSPIDILVVNLYPFEATVAGGGAYGDCVENIDIGGPAMLRAAAKNHAFVAAATDPADYGPLLDELNEHDGWTSYAFRQKLAVETYARTAAYDAAVSTWMARHSDHPAPRYRAVGGRLIQTMRYGENPHQFAAFYGDGSARPGVTTAAQHQGKELSWNNVNDTDAAFALVSEFAPAKGPACVIVKHANPCGVATGATLRDAYGRAYDCDRTSAFGGIVALNQPLDADTAREITSIFTEVVIAPEADDGARAIFAEKPNLRLLTTGGLADPAAAALSVRQVSGGFLVQDSDNGHVGIDDLRLASKREPTDGELADLLFAWTVVKHVKSNAIVYAKGGATVGIGAGQMSRVDSTRIAARKAGDMAQALNMAETPTKGSVVASDAFFPFPDGLLTAAKAGATAVIQPGGSMRDDKVIEAADNAGLAMVFTGMRHFRH